MFAVYGGRTLLSCISKRFTILIEKNIDNLPGGLYEILVICAFQNLQQGHNELGEEGGWKRESSWLELG